MDDSDILEDQGKNLWSTLLQEVKEKSLKSFSNPSTLLIVGDEKTGKSSILSRLQKSDLKSGGALEFDYIEVKDESLEKNHMLNVWLASNETFNNNLLKFALNESNFSSTLCLLILSYSSSWDMLQSAGEWLNIIQKHSERLKIDHQQIEFCKESLVQQFRDYTEPELPQDSENIPSTKRRDLSYNYLHPQINDDPNAVLVPLESGMIDVNIGLPIIVVVTKTDYQQTLQNDFEFNDDKFDFIQMHLRKLCLKYGAALCYTSLKDDKNCELLYRYIMHRCYGFPFYDTASVIEKDAIFIPAGWDNSKKINILSENISETVKNQPYDDIINKPLALIRASTQNRTAEPDVAEDEQMFLVKQQVIIQKMKSDDPSSKNQEGTRSGAPLSKGSSVNTGQPNRSKKGILNQGSMVVGPNSQQNPQGNEGVLANFFNSLLHKKGATGAQLSNQNSIAGSTKSQDSDQDPNRESLEENNSLTNISNQASNDKRIPPSEITSSNMSNIIEEKDEDTSNDYITKTMDKNTENSHRNENENVINEDSLIQKLEDTKDNSPDNNIQQHENLEEIKAGNSQEELEEKSNEENENLEGSFSKEIEKVDNNDEIENSAKNSQKTNGILECEETNEESLKKENGNENKIENIETIQSDSVNDENKKNINADVDSNNKNEIISEIELVDKVNPKLQEEDNITDLSKNNEFEDSLANNNTDTGTETPVLVTHDNENKEDKQSAVDENIENDKENETETFQKSGENLDKFDTMDTTNKVESSYETELERNDTNVNDIEHLEKSSMKSKVQNNETIENVLNNTITEESNDLEITEKVDISNNEELTSDKELQINKNVENFEENENNVESMNNNEIIETDSPEKISTEISMEKEEDTNENIDDITSDNLMDPKNDNDIDGMNKNEISNQEIIETEIQMEKEEDTNKNIDNVEAGNLNDTKEELSGHENEVIKEEYTENQDLEPKGKDEKEKKENFTHNQDDENINDQINSNQKIVDDNLEDTKLISKESDSENKECNISEKTDELIAVSGESNLQNLNESQKSLNIDDSSEKPNEISNSENPQDLGQNKENNETNSSDNLESNNTN